MPLGYCVGAGLTSRKNPMVEGVSPTVPVLVGRHAEGINVHLYVPPMRVGAVLVVM